MLEGIKFMLGLAVGSVLVALGLGVLSTALMLIAKAAEKVNKLIGR